MVAKSRTKQLRFGLVTMESPEMAQRCIQVLSGSELKGKKITVELVWACPDSWFVVPILFVL